MRVLVIKLYTFYFQDIGIENKIVKVETSSRLLRNFIVSEFILLPAKRVSENVPDFVENFALRIEWSSKKRYREREISPPLLKGSALTTKEGGRVISFSTPMGSWSKIDYNKRYAKVGIRKGDPLLDYLIFRTRSLIFLFMRIVRVHGAVIKNRRRFFIFVGKSGAGKTMIGELALLLDENNALLDDDSLSLISVDATPYVLYGPSFESELFSPVSYIFFVVRERKCLSNVFPISNREAFKRILFHSDVIFNNDDTEIVNRIKVLERLAFNCKSFILINGKNLKNNPKELRRLIYKVIGEN